MPGAGLRPVSATDVDPAARRISAVMLIRFAPLDARV